MNHTLSLLEQHHGDGHQFMQLMKETAARRFNQDFWQTWDDWIEPVLPEQPKIADLGCGPGMFLHYLRDRYPQAQLFGVEYAPYMLEEIDKNSCEIIIHDLHEANLPISDHELDAAVTVHTLHEISQPLRTLQNIYRCLKPGGRAVIMDWVRSSLKAYLSLQEYEIFNSSVTDETLSDIFIHFIEHNRYSFDDISWLLENVGFHLRYQRYLADGHHGLWIVEK